jgi:tetratricopeptide (TPR) repeat protein
VNNSAHIFSQICRELYALVDSDPVKAIKKARASELFTQLNDTNAQIVKSATLIDAGSIIRSESAISEGCDILNKLTAKRPNDHNLSYNLANGLIAKADISPVKSPDWYLLTADLRREARSLFYKVADASRSNELKARAITNLGNSLFKAHRWVEAYDNYVEALNSDPSNAVAATGAAKILLRCIDRRVGNREILRSIAGKHLKSAKVNIERLRQLAGKQAVQQLQPLLQTDSDVPQIPLGALSKYEKFVFENRLALSPTIEGLAVSLKRWDNLTIRSVIEGLNKDANVPPIFAMMNTLKGDFLAARRMAFDAIHHAPKDTGSYSDTLDYAVYGIRSSLLVFAQRACLDILDKIAVAITEYFELGDNKKSIYFHHSRWFTKQSTTATKRSWHPHFLKSINGGNRIIIALAEMALDLEEDGFLCEQKESRSAGTHRFVVLHDIGKSPSRECPYINHSNIKDFKQITLHSLRLARAAIIYFVELIALEERTRSKGIKTFPLVVPSHHKIQRGRRAW